MGVLFKGSHVVCSRYYLTPFSMVIFIFAMACLAAHISDVKKNKK